jgi:hypothetical protein
MRIAQLWADMAQGMESQFTGIFVDAFQGKLKTLGDYFNSFSNMMLLAWSRAMGNMLSEWIQTQARMSSEGGLMNTIGKWIGGGLGMDTGGGWTPENAGTFEKGDVFGGPRVFRFAQGIGMLGEAGPEGVLPLKRTSSGDLGVQVAGGAGGGGNVKVEIINPPGQQLKATDTKVRFNGQEMVVSVWLDAFNRNAYGLRSAMGV